MCAPPGNRGRKSVEDAMCETGLALETYEEQSKRGERSGRCIKKMQSKEEALPRIEILKEKRRL